MWRIIIGLLLFLLSLLVLFKAPTNFLWRLTVGITEFPYISILVSLIFFLTCLYAERFKLPLILASGITVLIYSLPIVQVYLRGRNLEKDLNTHFRFQAKDDYLAQPFSLIKLFTGVGAKKTEPEILIYKKLLDKNLSLDFFRSAGEKKRPCVIVIHGGSWAGGDSKQLPSLNYYLKKTGYHVAAINYRLAPKYKSPAQVEDTKDAMNYLKNNSEALNIDTNNFVLVGRSAGAQIALVSAYTFHTPNIKGVISLYGPADMVWGARFKSNKLVLNTEQVFKDYLGGLIDEVPDKYHEASSTDFVNPNSPPTLLIHGPNDPLVSYNHSVRLTKKLIEHKIPHYFLNLPWATHGCDYNINGPSGQITTYTIERFINSVVKE